MAPDPYRVCFSFKHTIADLSQHPYPKEWLGEPLDFLGPMYEGRISTAAGKYQLTIHTWRTCQQALSLPDFGPDSQDAAATLLIKQRGAYQLVLSGQTAEAISRCNGIWASLPGSTSKQPQKTMAALLQVYGEQGGAFA